MSYRYYVRPANRGGKRDNYPATL